MPCNSDHMMPNYREKESRKVIELLLEVGLYEGEAPYYGEVDNLDYHTEMLCNFCQKHDITRNSLELQIWWRDHQAADRERAEREIMEIQREEDRKAALSKLTPYEKKLIGI